MSSFGDNLSANGSVCLNCRLNGFGCGGRSSPRRRMKVDALSDGEWNYIRGLFLADGYVDAAVDKGQRSMCFRVLFILQMNEIEIANKVAEMLRRAGLNPNVARGSRENEIVVRIYSKCLVGFLPDKNVLKNDVASRARFFEVNGLLSVENGVPFLAGLLDGDGHCGLRFSRDRLLCASWDWRFAQSALLFLTDYVCGFLQRFDEDIVKVTRSIRRDGRVETQVKFRRRVVEALLRLGIDRWSWKAAQFLEGPAKFRSEREKYFTVGEVARLLNVSVWAVKRLVDLDEMKCLRKGRTSRKLKDLSWRYIPVDEVEKFRKRHDENREKVEKVKREGMKLVDVAKMLGGSSVSPLYFSLWKMHRCGKLRATMVREGRGRGYLVVPMDEIERLKGERGKSGDC